MGSFLRFCFLLGLGLTHGIAAWAQEDRAAIEVLSVLEWPGLLVTDVWGLTHQGADYALIGWQHTQEDRGLLIVDVADPRRPVEVARVTGVPGFDVKVWNGYAYVVTGGPDRGTEPEGRILDLSIPAQPQVVGTFPSAHNVFISDAGILYAEVPGLRIYDLTEDPTAPRLLWNTEPRHGHDASVVGNRLYDFHGRAGTFIYDVTNPAAPALLGTITHPRIAYHHSGYPTADGNYLFICDELAQPSVPDITVWDIRQPDDPQRVATITDEDATVHNLYIVGSYAYVSYYQAGFRVYDVADPTQPTLVDTYDTSPNTAGPGFGGAWGVYPFTPSGTVYVSGSEYAASTDTYLGSLHLFSVDGMAPTSRDAPESSPTLHLSNYPNPVAARTTVTYSLDRFGPVQLRVFDVLGREVRRLVDGTKPPGTHRVSVHMEALPNGTYLLHLEAAGQVRARPITVLRH
jgi:choice-of-anchor B domain-containing protein